MNIAIFCVLLVVSTHAFTIPNPVQPDNPTIQPDKQAVQPGEQTAQPDHNINKRFIMTALLMNQMLDDDDYDDVFPLRGRRPSRRTLQLAQMIRQLAGPQGLTPAQLQNMQQNLQNLQLMQNMQQLMPMQNLQSIQPVGQQG